MNAHSYVIKYNKYTNQGMSVEWLGNLKVLRQTMFMRKDGFTVIGTRAGLP